MLRGERETFCRSVVRVVAPLPGATLIFWLAGSDGKYAPAYETTVLADANGAYRFESIYPGTNEGIARCIHLFVVAGGHHGIETVYQPAPNQTENTFNVVLAAEWPPARDNRRGECAVECARIASSLLLVTICLALAACTDTAPSATSPADGPPAASVAHASVAPAPTPAEVSAVPAATSTATAIPTATRTPTVTPTATPRMAMAIAPGATRYVITPQQSQATYRVGEKFFGQGISVRVATVSGVAGDLYIDRQRPAASSAGRIAVDIRGMTSDLPGHDGARNDYLDTSRYPHIVYTPKRLVGLLETPYVEGQDLTFQVVGDMIVGMGKSEVTFDMSGKIEGTTFTGTATAKVRLSNFGYEAPHVAALELDDNVYLEVTIVAERTG